MEDYYGQIWKITGENFEDYYRMDLKEIRWDHLDFIDLVQDREK